MSYTGDKKREYAREWVANRRKKWLDDHGPCVICGSNKNLEIDHIDRLQKEYPISWTSRCRESELEKCQVLCYECHKKKTHTEMGWDKFPHGKTQGYRRGCRCADCTRAQSVRIAERRKRTGKR